MRLHLVFFVGLLIPIAFSALCSDSKTQSQCQSVAKCVWSSNACKCKDTLADFVFLIDESGSVKFDGFKIQRTFLLDVLDQAIPANSGVGIAEFGSGVSVVSPLLPYKTLSQVRTSLAGITWGEGATHMGDAIRQGLDQLALSTKPNKIIFLATDGKPNGGTIANPCDLKTEIANTPGLHIIIVGVSSGFDKNKVTCLVQHEPNPNDWIITVDRYDSALLSAILPDLDGRFCPDGFQLKVTEIRPVGNAFVEILNEGTAPALLKDISVSGLFSGRLAAPSSTATIPVGGVVVLYDSGTLLCTKCECSPRISTTPEAVLCDQAIYVACTPTIGCSFLGTIFGYTYTQFSIEVADATASPAIPVNTVTYDTNPNVGWPNVTTGTYSYELKDFNIANNRGNNWGQSCFQSGTPGAMPVSNCTVSCTDRCKSGGDGTATCDTQTNTCTCSGQYYVENNVCLSLIPPAYCNAVMKKVGNNSYEVSFDWGTVSNPPNARYEGSYTRDDGSISTFTESSNSKTIVDQNEPLFLSSLTSSYGQIKTKFTIAGGNTGDRVFRSTARPCIPETAAPTPSPVPDPTNLYSYFSGTNICGSDRCGCTGTGQRLCDPSFTASDNLNRKLIPNANNFIELKRSPPRYQQETRIQWAIYSTLDNQPIVNVTQSVGRRLLSSAPVGTLPFNNVACTTPTEQVPVCPPWNTTVIPAGDSPSIPINLRVFKNSNAYFLRIIGCTSPTDDCNKGYPNQLTVTLDGTAASNAANVTSGALPIWLWFLIAALILLLVFMSFLAYRWWVRNKVTSAELDTTKKDLDTAITEQELGFGHDLGGDIEYNPMATGVPGQNVVSDPYGTEMNNRRNGAMDNRADVAVEKFGYRQQMGQVHQGGMHGDN